MKKLIVVISAFSAMSANAIDLQTALKSRTAAVEGARLIKGAAEVKEDSDSGKDDTRTTAEKSADLARRGLVRRIQI